MAAKSTLLLAAFCCALATACPQPADAWTPDADGTAAAPSLAAAILPARNARVSCTGCLSYPSSTRAVVVDTARAGKDGKAPNAGSATLRLPGFASGTDGHRLDLALKLEVTTVGLEDGDTIIDFSSADPTEVLLGNPHGTGGDTFTVTMRLLEPGTGLEAQSDLELGIERIAASKEASVAATPVGRRAADGAAPDTFTWSGGGVFRVTVTDPVAPGAPDGDASARSNESETDREPSREQDRPQGDTDGGDEMTPGDDVEIDEREEKDDESEDAGKGGIEPNSDESPAAVELAAEDPAAVDAGTLDGSRDCCTALVALDAPQELAAADYPVTSAASRRIGSLSLPKQFPLTYLPSGEIVAPTLLRVLGATTGWMDVRDISIRDRATDAKVHLSTRKADGTLEEWYDGETFLPGWRRFEIMEDVDFVMTLEGFSYKTDGDLIEASVYGAQPLFTLAFTYDPNFPPSDAAS